MQINLRRKIIAMSKFFFYMAWLQCLFVTATFANNGNAQQLESARISNSWEKVKLETAFADIQNQTDFFFTYDSKKIENLTVSSTKEELPLLEVLKFISAETGLKFSITDDLILVEYEMDNLPETFSAKKEISIPSLQVLEQMIENVIYQVNTINLEDERIISGTVVSENGDPLVGVTIQIKGMNLGTSTDASGQFSLSVPDEGEIFLIVSYIGYYTEEVNVSERSVINIIIRENVEQIDEIVVVGYGTQKKSDVTGAISSLPESRLSKVPNLNVAQAIQGAIPGVTVTQNSAGAASSESIIVRGRNSILANNSPLIIVDKIPYNGELRDINVNDIESMEVLRDASSTAIYGSRGSNGVILITTKTGRSGKPTISYDGRAAIQRADRIPNYMNGVEFYDFKEIRELGNLTTTEINNFENQNYADWHDLAVRDGNSFQHSLNISGGTDFISYLLGGSFLDVKGITQNDDYARYTGRANIDINITDWLKIGTRTQYSVDDRSGIALSLSDIGRKNPLINVYDEDGDITIYPWPEFTDIGNPLEPLNYENEDKSRQLLSNNYLRIDFPFLQGLSYQLNTGITERFANISTYRGRNTKVGLEAGGTADVEDATNKSRLVENILDYSRQFGKHQFGATALYSYQKDKVTSNALYMEGFPNDITNFYNGAQAQVIIPQYGFAETNLISNMLRLNYSYRSRYFVTLTGRRDGFSGFGEDNKWGNFGTVAAAWTLSNESFFPEQSLVDFLKFRVSYGGNGNQAVDPYQSIAKYRASNFVDNNTSLPGVVPENLANNQLGWETSISSNIGMDFGLFNNSLFGSIDYFNTKTEDLLLNRTISPVHGIGLIVDNIGETKNTGLELSLNTSQEISNDFIWSANLNLAFLSNEIVSLGLGQDGEVDDVASGLFIGEAITSNFDFEFDGVWQLNEADEAAVFGSVPGYIKIKDINGDGMITADDRTIIGQTDPKYIWGMTNSFSYKNFMLSFFIHGVHGVTKENELFQDASASSGVRRNVILKNWWTPENPTNDFYSNDVDAGTMQGFRAPIYQNASFIRFKDITLSFDLPKNYLEKIGLRQTTIYFTGRNLFTITDWQESDPELDAGRGTIPLQKEFVFGLTVKI